MRRIVLAVSTAVTAAVVLGACGTEPGPAPTAEPTAPEPTTSTEPESRPELPGGGDNSPPPVVLDTAAGPVELSPWTYCYGTGCSDGVKPAKPVSVGDPGSVEFGFSQGGWDFEATFEQVSVRCPGRITVPVQRLDDHWFRLGPAGVPGTYDVTLFGRGGGDVSVTFRWTTPEAGTLAEPDAYLGVIASLDGEVDSYGVELSVNDVEVRDRAAEARVTVTAANGSSLTFRPNGPQTCWSANQLFWNGPDARGTEAAALGDPPFRYRVELTMDDRRYVGTGRWPDDVIAGWEPYVALDFDPPLPPYDGR